MVKLTHLYPKFTLYYVSQAILKTELLSLPATCNQDSKGSPRSASSLDSCCSSVSPSKALHSPQPPMENLVRCYRERGSESSIRSEEFSSWSCCYCCIFLKLMPWVNWTCSVIYCNFSLNISKLFLEEVYIIQVFQVNIISPHLSSTICIKKQVARIVSFIMI